MQIDEGRNPEVADRVRTFIVSEFLFDNTSALPDDEQSLIAAGIIDSTGVLELIEFVEDQFGFTVAETETVPENLGSIAALTHYILEKTGAAKDST